MLKTRNYQYKSLYDLELSRKNRIGLSELKEGEKITIFSDRMFKTMFQNENRLKYSAKLISYYVDIDYEELLKNIRLGKNELDKKKKKNKGERCDYVASINNSTINIEVNNNANIKTLERNIEYAFRLFSKYVTEGKNKDQYTQVIQLDINNFSFQGNKNIVDVNAIQNKAGLLLTEKLIFIQIYVPNLIRKWYDLGKEKLEESEKFLLALVLKDINISKELGEGIEIMKEYIEEAQEVVLDDDLRESYDKELAMKEWGYDEGRIEGYSNGKLEGEKDKTIEIAKNMLKEKETIEKISLYTGLSQEEQENIQKEQDSTSKF